MSPACDCAVMPRREGRGAQRAADRAANSPKENRCCTRRIEPQGTLSTPLRTGAIPTPRRSVQRAVTSGSHDGLEASTDPGDEARGRMVASHRPRHPCGGRGRGRLSGPRHRTCAGSASRLLHRLGLRERQRRPLGRRKLGTQRRRHARRCAGDLRRALGAGRRHARLRTRDVRGASRWRRLGARGREGNPDHGSGCLVELAGPAVFSWWRDPRLRPGESVRGSRPAQSTRSMARGAAALTAPSSI